MRASLFSCAEDNAPFAWDSPADAPGGAWAAFCEALTSPATLPPHPDPEGRQTEAQWKRTKATQIPAWSPATFKPGSTRASANVDAVHAFVVDLDDVPIGDIPAVLARFDAFEYLAHTSPGVVRCPAGVTRLRLILPLATPVIGKDWPRVWGALMARFELAGLPYVDATCKGSAWIYFSPCQGAHIFRNRGIYLAATTRDTCTARDLQEVGALLSRRKATEVKAIGLALRKAAAGEMYAQHPNRDETMREMTWHLAQHRPNLEPDSVATALAPAMAAPGALADDPDARRVAALFLGALEKQDSQAIVPVDGKRLREAWAPSDRGTPLTDEEIAALGVDEHEWILLHGKSCYLHGPTGYVGPFGLVDGAVAALTYLAPSPVQLYSVTANGTVRQRSITEMCEDSGRAIRASCVDLTAQAPHYDRDENCFYEATCPIRPFEAEYNAEIAGWLMALCGQVGIESMIRWLYWLTDLSKPLASLYITGPGDTGKSLLVTELSKLWTSKGPCDLEGALAGFNDAMTHCPLIFGDEFVPTGKGDEIKRLISERDRPLRRKYISDNRAIGCVRLVLASNNMRFADSYGDMTQDDIEAHLDRFVGIDARHEAVEYLRNHDVQAWVDSNAIPKFALWVREAFAGRVESVGRFLVRGRSEKLRTALGTRTGSRALVCEWLASFVKDPKQGLVSSKGGLRVAIGPDGNARLLVKAWAVRDCWELYARSKADAPRIGQINVAIGALSRAGHAVIAGVKYNEINLETFGAWCADVGLYDRDELKKQLDTIGRNEHKDGSNRTTAHDAPN